MSLRLGHSQDKNHLTTYYLLLTK